MRHYLAIALIVLLAGFGAAGGYFGTTAYLGARGSFDGMNHACQTLQIAEARQVITPQQRAAIVDAMMREAARSSRDKSAADAKVVVDYLKGDCSRSLWETVTGNRA